jgi:hypothetical protein
MKGTLSVFPLLRELNFYNLRLSGESRNLCDMVEEGSVTGF